MVANPVSGIGKDWGMIVKWDQPQYILSAEVAKVAGRLSKRRTTMKNLLTSAMLGLTMISSAQAALYCENEYGDTLTWYVGQEVPSINLEGLSCMANNAELNYIYERFNNVPQIVIARHDYRKPVLWRGDAAVFIMDNLN
jgi:hypothetical protein